ncbi:swr1-complex protein 4 [Phaffia rhodozyma]|uniref:SWR1-complex protein 4 n=1 Tax=Phaffia rhodozyma TaxID=264483 RepID=A0A0F7SPU3_PHARH|nr:swr1-complex protein 4 [Phaffia rhodozyma]
MAQTQAQPQPGAASNNAYRKPMMAPSHPSSLLSASSSRSRIEGPSREVFALIGDSAPSIQASNIGPSKINLKERPKARKKGSRWEWKSFTPTKREEDGLFLSHWVRATDESSPEKDAFAKYNTATPVMDFSQAEYDDHLRDDNWSHSETLYLFALLRTYDLRFVVVADRYAYPGEADEYINLPGGGKKQSIEDIKSRYYSICRRLVRSRPTGDENGKLMLLQSYAFDKEREVARKTYANSLFQLSAQQIAEEEALYLECKRMEQQERKFKSERDDLMRMLGGFESGLVGLPGRSGETGAGGDKKRKDVLGLDGPSAASTSSAANKKADKLAKADLLHCIYRVPPPIPGTNPPGPTGPGSKSGHTSNPTGHQPVYLRSTRLPIPAKPNLAEPIFALLNDLRPPVPLPGKLTMPTRGSQEKMDGLMAAAMGLVEMKRAVDKVEEEVRMLNIKLEEKRKAKEGNITAVKEEVVSGISGGQDQPMDGVEIENTTAA